MERDALTYGVIGAAIEIQKELGVGLLESAYEICLNELLREKGFRTKSQVYCPINYKNLKIDTGYRIDIVVEDCLIIELKAVDQLSEAHSAQILTYMKLSNKPLGLLINFNSFPINRGIKRFVI